MFSSLHLQITLHIFIFVIPLYSAIYNIVKLSDILLHKTPRFGFKDITFVKMLSIGVAESDVIYLYLNHG